MILRPHLRRLPGHSSRANACAVLFAGIERPSRTLGLETGAALSPCRSYSTYMASRADQIGGGPNTYRRSIYLLTCQSRRLASPTEPTLHDTFRRAASYVHRILRARSRGASSSCRQIEMVPESQDAKALASCRTPIDTGARRRGNRMRPADFIAGLGARRRGRSQHPRSRADGYSNTYPHSWRREQHCEGILALCSLRSLRGVDDYGRNCARTSSRSRDRLSTDDRFWESQLQRRI